MNSAALFPLHGHRLLALPAILAAIFFLFLAFKARGLLTKLVLFLFAAALFAGAFWWFTNIRS